MPTYDYVCGACKHHLEIFQSMTEAVKRKCPACGKLKLVRQIGLGGGILFKGSGFYQTDYRSDSYKKAAEADNGKSKPSKEPSKESSKESSKEPSKESPKESSKERSKEPTKEPTKESKSEPPKASASASD